MLRPKISILLPVHNAARYLRTAMDSLLAQTFCDFEVIAVDDGSTDRSLEILRDYERRDQRLRVFSRSRTGIVGALNDGLKAAHGEFIARMDADDVAESGRLAAQVAFLVSHPACVALGTDVLYTDPEGAPLIRHKPATTHDEIVARLLEGNGGALIHPSVMFRRDAIERVGGYRERFQWIEDLDLYLRLSEVGELANLPDVYLRYRQHLKSINRTMAKREDLRWEIVNFHRARLGLAALDDKCDPVAVSYSRPGWRRHWAYDAARGGQWLSARKNAWRAVLLGPFDRNNWRCLHYVMGASTGIESHRPEVASTFP